MKIPDALPEPDARTRAMRFLANAEDILGDRKMGIDAAQAEAMIALAWSVIAMVDLLKEHGLGEGNLANLHEAESS